MSKLEQIYNTMSDLNKVTDNFAHWTFADLWEALPAYMKVKQDPRPQEGKMQDWKFSEHLEECRRIGMYIPNPGNINKTRFASFPPQNQLIGSCVGESAANIMESFHNEACNLQGRAGICLSGQFVYWFAEQLDEDLGEGSFLWAACEALRNHGACLNILYKESADYRDFLLNEPSHAAIEDGKKRLLSSYYIADDNSNVIDHISIALQMGYGVQVAVMSHSGWDTSPVIEERKRGERLLGGHAIQIDAVDYDRKLLTIFNSWGIGGDGTGHWKMRFGYLLDNAFDIRILIK